jgi:hypothetical protein
MIMVYNILMIAMRRRLHRTAIRYNNSSAQLMAGGVL